MPLKKGGGFFGDMSNKFKTMTAKCDAFYKIMDGKYMVTALFDKLTSLSKFLTTREMEDYAHFMTNFNALQTQGDKVQCPVKEETVKQYTDLWTSQVKQFETFGKDVHGFVSGLNNLKTRFWKDKVKEANLQNQVVLANTYEEGREKVRTYVDDYLMGIRKGTKSANKDAFLTLFKATFNNMNISLDVEPLLLATLQNAGKPKRKTPLTLAATMRAALNAQKKLARAQMDAKVAFVNLQKAIAMAKK